MKTTDSRIPWIDSAKFIGIFAIVLGHVLSEGFIKHYLYSFHVPLFFFASGLTFNVLDKRFIPFIKRRFESLMIPFYIFSIISVAIFFVIEKLTPISLSQFVDSGNIKESFLEILMGYCNANRPLWFLPCFFTASIIAYVIIKATKNNKHCIIATIVFFIILQYLNNTFLHISILPFKLETVITLLPFLMIGYLLKPLAQKLLGTKFKYHKLIYISISILLLLAGGLLGIYNKEAGYLGNYYGNTFIFYISALLTIFGVCIIGSFIYQIKIMNYIGQHTLPIMLMHKFPIEFICILFIKSPLKDSNFIIALSITIISIILCCLVELLILKICPFILGKRKLVMN